MTPEAQRIAIAEACGWKDVKESYKGNVIPLPTQLIGDNKSLGIIRRPIPNYLSDLNAMHEAEKCPSLLAQGLFVYRANLAAIVKRDALKTDSRAESLTNEDWIACSIGSTAAQRAEAFLRTLNLWKE